LHAGDFEKSLFLAYAVSGDAALPANAVIDPNATERPALRFACEVRLTVLIGPKPPQTIHFPAALTLPDLVTPLVAAIFGTLRQ
jgi:hypothetical protein